MLRIRLHGRGGQGIKTAGQILGTAAYLSGFQAQDFPLYGAERRGAPIVAYTRIDPSFIRERGTILHPDILMVGDETLLEDIQAAPLAGTDRSTLLFINSTHSAQDLKKHFDLPGLPLHADLAELCLKYIGKETLFSTALSAAAARVTGVITLDSLLEAVRIELADTLLSKDMVDRNLDLVREVFHLLPEGHPVMQRNHKPVSASSLIDLLPVDPTQGAPVILNPGNMELRKTGNWRTHRPEIDYESCNACGICYARCPDGDIRLNADDKPIIDYDHCKGCLICATECPKHAIHIAREVTSWN